LDDSELARLSLAQRAALRHVQDVVGREGAAVHPRLTDLLQRGGCAADGYSEATEYVWDHARVVVHFHSDRLGPKSSTVAEALLSEGL
jgi:hypothetical protein